MGRGAGVQSGEGGEVEGCLGGTRASRCWSVLAAGNLDGQFLDFAVFLGRKEGGESFQWGRWWWWDRCLLV